MPHVQVVNPGILLNFCNFVKQNVLPVYYKQLYKTEPLNHQRNVSIIKSLLLYSCQRVFVCHGLISERNAKYWNQFRQMVPGANKVTLPVNNSKSRAVYFRRPRSSAEMNPVHDAPCSGLTNFGNKFRLVLVGYRKKSMYIEQKNAITPVENGIRTWSS